MSAGKKIAAAAIAVVLLAGVGTGGYFFWKKSGLVPKKGTVYVMPVSDVNSAMGQVSLSGSRFAGVIETQKTEDVKFDSSKKIGSIAVKTGDEVKEGDVLFSYDAEALQIQLDQAKIEVERMQNEVDTSKVQLEELEKEKKSASQEAQTSLTTQILSLQSDIAKTEYDIKTKNSDIKKIENSIKNTDVTSPVTGSVKSALTLDEVENASSDVLVSISKGDKFLVKGTVNEQMINMIYTDMPVVIRSRVDDSVTWSGHVSSIETKPQSQSSEQEMYYGSEGDSSTQSSKYTFYIEPDSLDGLMIGQHIIIEPDYGIEMPDKEKTGIWLYSDFVVEEDGKTFVWAKGKNDRLEKREVKLGEKDEDMGDVQIKDGLTNDDCIAYPSEQFEAGMKTTDEYDKADVPEEDYSEEGEYDDEEIMPEIDGEEFEIDEDDLNMDMDDPNFYDGDLAGDFGVDGDELPVE